MLRLARLSIRRPALALVAWAVLALALSVIGLGVADRLSPSITTVAGTSSSRAQQLSDTRFGPGVLVPILLEGPARQLDRQGPALVRALDRRGDTRVLSAWDSGDAGAQLRPRPTAALVLVSVARSEMAMVNDVQPQIDRTVHQVVGGPVRASITGQPTLDRALKDRAIDATRLGLALTIPILFVLLLLILRAPIAAGGLTLLGATTSFAGLGLMALLGKVIDVDPTAVTVATMTGLALGVGYGLLLYRRWREELGTGGDHGAAAHAASAAVETTGRGVLIGGSALVVSLLLASVIAPSKILTSLGIGALLCSTLAVGAAVVVLPASLTLLGDRVMALSFPAPRLAQRAWERVVAGGNTVVRHAVISGAIATALLLTLAIPLTHLQTGPPSTKLLPPGDTARQSFDRVAAAMGPGWPTPYNVVVVSPRRPITDAAMLRRLDAFQAGLARDPRVDSVVGPGVFAATSKDLSALPKALRDSTKLLKGGKKDLGRLESGLGQAGAGATQLKDGLATAAGGATKLKAGSGQAQTGAGALRNGLDQAHAGAAKITAGLDSALGGARKLRDGASSALKGSKQLTSGLGQAVGPVKSGAPVVKQMAADIAASSAAVKGAQGGAQTLSAQLDEAAAQLQALPESAGRTNALGAIASAKTAAGGLQTSLTATGTTLDGAAGVAGAFSDQVAKLSVGLAQLHAGSSQLEAGIAQLQTGNAKLAAGIDKLSGGGGQLTGGVAQLRDGAAQLKAGLGLLTGGAGQLAGGLAGGADPTARLVAGLGQLRSGVTTFRGQLPSPKDLERLQRQSPGLFDSGYFVLAAIAGASPSQRTQASFAVNLTRGGDAGQITVVPRQGIETHATQALGADLQDRARAFAATTGTQVAVGGPAGALADFRTETATRIWPVVIGLALAVTLLLMALLRTVMLPLIAVGFDLLTAAATFGVLTLLFGGDDPLLGGAGYIDPMSIIAIFAFIFGVTMVYEVQLLQRTREKFLRTGDPHAALRTGLRRSAAGTGAALAMVAAVVPFAITGLITVRMLAVGIAVAITLDALVVRPVLLPAAVELLGRWSWWPTSRAAPHPDAPTSPPIPLKTPLAGSPA